MRSCVCTKRQRNAPRFGAFRLCVDRSFFKPAFANSNCGFFLRFRSAKQQPRKWTSKNPCARCCLLSINTPNANGVSDTLRNQFSLKTETFITFTTSTISAISTTSSRRKAISNILKLNTTTHTHTHDHETHERNVRETYVRETQQTQQTEDQNQRRKVIGKIIGLVKKIGLVRKGKKEKEKKEKRKGGSD